MANPNRDEAFHRDFCFELEGGCVTRETPSDFVVELNIDEVEFV